MIVIGPMFAVLIVIYGQSGVDALPHCPATGTEGFSDASTTIGFVRCKSTRAEVEARFGKPHSESVREAVTIEYFAFPNGSEAEFFFSDNGLLLRTLLYAEPSRR